MPNHLQSRTDDMHKGKASRGIFSLTSLVIFAVLVLVMLAILFLV